MTDASTSPPAPADPLALDPRAETGLVVEKSESNGVHDGRIVCCPRAALPSRVYQRLIDNIEV